ncbi:MAG: alkaline phosphatase family protein [Candidatus Wallbacteria bacterium]|nr:alkaline phosphatase family protein [Candidatus Wallbacteria bacterium]
MTRIFQRIMKDRLDQKLIERITIAFWIPLICLLILYPHFIPDFLQFPVNIFLVDTGASKTFIREFFTWNELLTPPLFVFLSILLLQKVPFSIPIKIPSVLSYLFVFAVVLTLMSPSPNPFVFGVQEILMEVLGGGKRVVPPLQQPRNASSATIENNYLSRIFKDFPGSDASSHVLILVMETVESSRFEKEILQNSQSFLGKHQDYFRYFSRYFTTNLDSFTSLLSMLTGISVPYPAYSDPERYAGIQKADNLAAAFRRSGKKTMFVCTAQNQPFIPVRGEWDQIITRREINPSSSMISIDSPPIEAALEDRSALPAIIDYMKNNRNTFILQECVFGHSQAWQDKTGITQLKYYDRYVEELLDSLQKQGLLEKTLLILIADHGSRRNPADPENYRIPLIFWGGMVKPGRDDRFLSQLCFARLIRELESPDSEEQTDEPILTVGHSGQWVYGEIRPNGDCQFIENSRGKLLRSQGNLNPLDLQQRFQKYLNQFTAQFPDFR